MNPIVVIIINLALVFYSIGVWSERIAGRLRVRHLIFFYLGFICDTWGTGMMFESAGKLLFNFHALTGVLAIVLMAVHAAWATVVLVKKDEKWLTVFHRFSVTVWVIWLIPYSGPMLMRLFTQ